jgi:hypothetical protein
MKTLVEQQEIVAAFHLLGETGKAAEFLLEEFQLREENFAGFEFREAAKPEYILMTTEGEIGESQKIRIPENTFEFPMVLMLNLLAHEMVHVWQKSKGIEIEDRNEREWQAYREMLFHKRYPLVPDASVFHQKFFASKAIEYYNRMEKDGELQQRYADQKIEIEEFVAGLEQQD